ncbi:hypothetical protein [Saccharothrix xinjiangensis]|uniref:Uncharacterized protein n=1 Tax=Saccharothrix xinjiangensis TaxID=204798 RepID=A0ABV9XUP3_9PSEU
MGRSNRVALIAEATVDCHDGSECVTGFHTMVEEHLAVPCRSGRWCWAWT